MAGESSEYQKGRTYVSDKKKKSMIMGNWIGGEKPDYPKKSTELLLVSDNLLTHVVFANWLCN